MKATIYTPSLRHKLAAALHTLAVLALPLALGTSCTTDELTSPAANTPGSSGEQITITANLNSSNSGSDNKPSTRMNYEQDATNGGIKTTWKKGDAFNIITWDNRGDPTKSSSFSLKSGEGTATGIFTGTKPEYSSSGYYILSPSSIKSLTDFYAFSYQGQKQIGNGTINHCGAYHSINLKTQNFYDLKFENSYQSSCMKFVLTPPAGLTKPTKITLAANDKSLCFYPTNDESTDIPMVFSLSLALEDITLAKDEKLTAYMMMSCETVTLPQKIRVTLTGEDNKKYYKIIEIPADNNQVKYGKTHSITVSDASSWKATSNQYTYYPQIEASLTLDTANGTDTDAGTADNPYLITCAEDLELLRNVTNATDASAYKDKYYKLTTDINIQKAEYSSWIPIGQYSNDDTSFGGTFDGDGHKVTGLKIVANNKNYQGFFGGIVGGTVKNLNVEGEVTSTVTNVGKLPGVQIGGIAGYNSGTIIGCSFKGTLSGNSARGMAEVGGIAGYNRGIITGCSSTATVAGVATGTYSGKNNQAYIGGIAGNNNGTITGCNSSSNVEVLKISTDTPPDVTSTLARLGGICGYADRDGYVIGCYNTGKITGTVTGMKQQYIGGIAGTSYNIVGCYNTGEVTGSAYGYSYIGGITADNEKIVTGCYNTGAIVVATGGNTNSGTLAGMSNDRTTTSYCQWVKNNDTDKAIDYNMGNATEIVDVPSAADISSDALNTGIKAWNDTPYDTSSPQHCHFRFVPGAGAPVLESTQQ